MKRLILITIFLSSLFLRCEKIDRDAPDCLTEKIRTFAKESICPNGAAVGQYLFKGVYVYVFSPGNCGADMGADVYNESCEKIGFLGGISGNLIIQGVIFHEEAEFIKTIWKD